MTAVEKNKHTNKNIEIFHHWKRQRCKKNLRKRITKMVKLSSNRWLISINKNKLNSFIERDNQVEQYNKNIDVYCLKETI